MWTNDLKVEGSISHYLSLEPSGLPVMLAPLPQLLLYVKKNIKSAWMKLRIVLQVISSFTVLGFQGLFGLLEVCFCNHPPPSNNKNYNNPSMKYISLKFLYYDEYAERLMCSTNYSNLFFFCHFHQIYFWAQRQWKDLIYQQLHADGWCSLSCDCWWWKMLYWAICKR